MPENFAKITLKLKGAEYFNTSVENIGVRTIRSKLLFDIVQLSFEQESVWMKIAHSFAVPEPFLQSFSLESEVLAREIITQSTKLKLNEIYEFNNSKDLLPNDYILFETPDGNLIESGETTNEIKVQIDEFQSHFYKVNNATFGDLLENNAFISWSAYFEHHWQQLSKNLQSNKLFDIQELSIVNDFYQSLKSTLTEESLPVLINLNLENSLFLESYGQICGYADYACCFWGTPEFELAKRDYLKLSETPIITAYKQQVQSNISVKARYFLYYVNFLLEESLIHFCLTGNTISSKKNKTMALTLIKNALS